MILSQEFLYGLATYFPVLQEQLVLSITGFSLNAEDSKKKKKKDKLEREDSL